MLKAMLHGKLGRPGANDDDEPGTSAWEALTSREDPLTAAVFSRLAYLEPSDAWALLRAACARSAPDEPRLAEAPPSGRPVFSFWPNLRPAKGSFNVDRVQPDVLIEWGDIILVVEVKHLGAQAHGQWVEEVRAVRADPRFSLLRPILLAVGGAELDTFAALASSARSALGSGVDLLLLRWDALHEAADAARGAASATASLIAGDIVAALEAWGHRRRIGFDSLPEAARRIAVPLGRTDLSGWRIK